MNDGLDSPSNRPGSAPKEAWNTNAMPAPKGVRSALRDRPVSATAVRTQPASFPPELVRWHVASLDQQDNAKVGHSANSQADSKPARGQARKKSVNGVLDELVQEKRQKEEKEEVLLRQATDHIGKVHSRMSVKADLLKKEMGISSTDGFSELRLKALEFISRLQFDVAIGFFIMLNGVSIGLETDTRVKLPLGCDSSCNCVDNSTAVCYTIPVWVVLLDLTCSMVYIIELGIRFYALRFFMFRSRWIQFDAFLVVASILEFILRNLNMENVFLNQIMLVRLFRLAKLARSLRLVPEFQTLWLFVGGLVSSLSVQVWTALLMMIMAYLFGLMGMEFVSVDIDLPLNHPYNDTAISYFRNLADALMTILQFFSFDSWGGIMRPMVLHKPYLFFYFITIVLLLSIGLLNLITGLMVDASLAAVAADKDVKKAMGNEKKRKQMLELQSMFGELDEDGSGELSVDELLSSPEDIQDTLCEIAGTEDLQGLFEALDYDGGGTLAIDEFCDGVFKFTSSEKPMEIDRLCKQAADVLVNFREAVQILKAEPGDEDEVVSLDEGSSPKKPNPRMENLEVRVDVLNLRIKRLSTDVTEILQGMFTLFDRKQAQMAKTVAVYKMR